jgi:pyridoxal phosphate enzyme (YggS family)
MAVNKEKYREVLAELGNRISLVAVSKTKSPEDIKELYGLGQRDFGENYVQELTEKQPLLPADIRWHFIGHLQSNKVKYIASFVHLIQGVDSLKLLKEIDKQAAIHQRVINCLLQVHIAREETKFGLDGQELEEMMAAVVLLKNIHIAGLMGMASFTDDPGKQRNEFRTLKALFDKYFPASPEAARLPLDNRPPAGNPVYPPVLSMGMSGDYKIAVEEGSNMVRIGSLLFGRRD